ncbi:matrixin family metalloprotease [Gorillibacterium sp. CAU 1737]|uniref:matrixin family metalloprotease n=1 Tax=Gorillibacterium sp. CAU 1737 TaxID=3140362 RepID=UPI003260A000
MKKGFRFASLVSTLLVLSLLITTAASAFTLYGKKLIGGVKDRTYWVDNPTYIFKDSDGTYKAINYGTYIDIAVQNWNNSVNNENKFERTTDVYFTKAKDRASATVIFTVAEYGNTGWDGKTFFFKDGVNVAGQSEAPTKDYDKVTIGINVSLTYKTEDHYKVSLAGHEFGHALGLDHFSGGPPYSLMNKYVSNAPFGPTADDVTGVQKIYSK